MRKRPLLTSYCCTHYLMKSHFLALRIHLPVQLSGCVGVNECLDDLCFPFVAVDTAVTLAPCTSGGDLLVRATFLPSILGVPVATQWDFHTSSWNVWIIGAILEKTSMPDEPRPGMCFSYCHILTHESNKWQYCTCTYAKNS